MDPKIGWFQPEQEGPAKEFWMRIWDFHINSREHLKANIHDYGHNVFYKNAENIENIPENYKRMPLNANNNHSINRASTYAMNRFQDALIGKYGGCPWRIRKYYDPRPIYGYGDDSCSFNLANYSNYLYRNTKMMVLFGVLLDCIKKSKSFMNT